MEYSFIAYGHPNITAKHKNTIEWTTDKCLSVRGDCIIGVNSDFDFEQIKPLIKKNNKIVITIKVDDISEAIYCDLNPLFEDHHEIVIRRGDFRSKRTLGINSDKACIDLKKDLIKRLKKKDNKIEVKLITNP
jgi:hypothetical protein